MNKTNIDWCDVSWNPATGCNNGCEYCYAKEIAKRFSCGDFKPTFHRERLKHPAKVKKPQKVFVCSMADLFGEWVSSETIMEVLDACAKASQHTYLFLTKNPSRYLEFIFPENSWLGFSASTQKAYSDGMDSMKLIRGNKFVSLEPLHEQINIKEGVDWVIIGAETGKREGKIVPKTTWVHNLIYSLQRSKTPIFLKDNLKWHEKIQEFPKAMDEIPQKEMFI